MDELYDSQRRISRLFSVPALGLAAKLAKCPIVEAVLALLEPEL